MKLSLSATALVLAAAFITAPSFAQGHGHGLFKKLDQDGDGKITIEEARTVAKEHFARLDVNQDRVVTLTEAKEAKAMHKKDRGPSEERMAEHFARQDKNKNGKIERNESHMPARWFDAADLNKDDALTQEEVKSAWERWKSSEQHQKAKAKHEAHFDKFFAKMDADKDGKITEAEAVASADVRFSRVDKDADGTITSDEAKAAHPRGAHHGKKGPHKGHGKAQSHQNR